MKDEKVYFNPKFLETLKRNLQMSPETWHKVMNPLCGKCMVERGRTVIEESK